MRQKGCHTLGQDEATCVVYGMPRSAWMRGAVEQQAPLNDIASRLVTWCGREA
jgi:two-component system chemotaxis response regulator CheB